MKGLKLRFGEERDSHPLTSSEINDLVMAAHSALAISHVMKIYGFDFPAGEENDTLGIYGCAFLCLEWLLEPVKNYLCEHAGHEAAPEPKALEGVE